MRVTVRADGGTERDPLAKELAAFLNDQQQLRGRAHLTEDRQQPGGIGQSVAAIIIDLGPAVLGTFAGSLVAWLRHRTGNARITINRPDGVKIELFAERVRHLDGQNLNGLAKQLSQALAAPPPPRPEPKAKKNG